MTLKKRAFPLKRSSEHRVFEEAGRGILWKTQKKQNSPHLVHPVFLKERPVIHVDVDCFFALCPGSQRPPVLLCGLWSPGRLRSRHWEWAEVPSLLRKGQFIPITWRLWQDRTVKENSQFVNLFCSVSPVEAKCALSVLSLWCSLRFSPVEHDSNTIQFLVWIRSHIKST